MTGHEEARIAIAEGRAKAKALWVLLQYKNERDGHAIRPLRWEGAGEYQRVTFDDERGDVFVKLPDWRGFKVER